MDASVKILHIYK